MSSNLYCLQGTLFFRFLLLAFVWLSIFAGVPLTSSVSCLLRGPVHEKSNFLDGFERDKWGLAFGESRSKRGTAALKTSAGSEDVPVADFSAVNRFSLTSPANVQMVNTSTGADQYYWDFGDGFTSTEVSPMHLYQQPGSYSVMLVASSCADASCADTLIYENYIEIFNLVAPVPSYCYELGHIDGENSYINRVKFAEIDVVSGYGNNGYQDFTENDLAFVLPNQQVRIEVFCESAQRVFVWLDFDGNGFFSENEKVMASEEASTAFVGVIHIPEEVQMGVPLRMRVRAHTYYLTPPCSSLIYGECEDYSVLVQPEQSTLNTDFFCYSDTVFVGSEIEFLDLSNGATHWDWILEGSVAGSSNERNPLVTYQHSGLFSAQLSSSKDSLQDVEVKNDFVTVVRSYNLCEVSGSDAANGLLYDSGGENNIYDENEDCSFLIQPLCGGVIEIDVLRFLTHSGDSLKIYDGINANAPLIFDESLISSVNFVTATSGAAFVHWESNSRFDGFSLRWRSEQSHGPFLDAQMTVSPSIVLDDAPVFFTNTTDGPFVTTIWDFGDGTQAIGDEVSYVYPTNGNYTASMNVKTCSETYTEQYQISVRGANGLFVDSFVDPIDLECARDSSFMIEMGYQGESPISWNLAQRVSLLIISQYVSESTLQEWLNFLHENCPNVEVSVLVNTYNLTTAQKMEFDIILLPERDYYYQLSDFGYYDDFLAAGKTIIHCQPNSPSLISLNSVGIFNAEIYNGIGSLHELAVLVPDDPINANIELQFEAMDVNGILDAPLSYVSLIQRESDSLPITSAMGYVPFGLGRYYYCGFSAPIGNGNIGELYKNIIQKASSDALPEWISFASDEGILEPSTTSQIQVTVSSDGMVAGTYTVDLFAYILANEGNQWSFPITLNVVDAGELTLEAGCISFGEISPNSYETAGTWLHNVSCDTAFIYNVAAYNQGIDVYLPNNFVLPYDSVWIGVGGLWTELGNFSDTIQVFGENVIINVCLEGVLVDVNSVVSNVQVTSLEIDNCAIAAGATFELFNHTDEEVEISFEPEFYQRSTWDILILTDGSILDLPEGIYAEIESLGIDNLTQTYGRSNDMEDYSIEELNEKELIILTEINSSLYANQFGLVLQSYIRQGGMVLLGPSGNPAFYQQLTIMNPQLQRILNSNTLCKVTEGSLYGAGVDAEVLSTPGSTAMYLPEPGWQNQITCGTLTLMASREMGIGEVVYFGFDMNGFSPELRQIFQNIVLAKYQDTVVNFDVVAEDSVLSPNEPTLISLACDGSQSTVGVVEFPLYIMNGIQLLDSVQVELNFQQAPCPSFEIIYDCNTANLEFRNTSIGIYTSCLWDFGNGITNNSYHCMHPYTSPGVYIVTLTLCNEFGCQSVMQTVTINQDRVDFIRPCQPIGLAETAGFDIIYVALDTLERSSVAGNEGYMDLTCSHVIEVFEGAFLEVLVETNTSENVYIYVDFDRNGIFNPATELFYESSVPSHLHMATIPIPIGGVLDAKIFLRVECSSLSGVDGCVYPSYGQIEDYGLIVRASTDPPIADFFVDRNIGSTLHNFQFINSSFGGATSYQWFFEGALVEESSEYSQSNLYYEPGVYDVMLIANNQWGSDTLLREDYITITEGFEFCSDVLFSNSATGFLSDNGGIDFYYNGSHQCSFLINPTCAAAIDLYFPFIDSGLGYDSLLIYLGTDLNSPVAAVLSGDYSNLNLHFDSNELLLVWKTSSLASHEGFEMFWTASDFNYDDALVDFSVSNGNPMIYELISFQNVVLENADQWTWDFGDGDMSNALNPQHAYEAAGIYFVTLYASNCLSSAEITYTVEVVDQLFFEHDPQQINLLVGCGNMELPPIRMKNNAGDSVNWTLESTNVKFKPKVLCLMQGADIQDVVDMYRIEDSLSNSFAFSYFWSNWPDGLADEIMSYDVVLILPRESNNPFYSDIEEVIVDYVTSGGVVIKLAGQLNFEEELNAILDGSAVGTIIGSQDIVINQNESMMNSFEIDNSSQPEGYYYYFFDPELIPLLTYNFYMVAAYKSVGLGRVYWSSYGMGNTNFDDLIYAFLEEYTISTFVWNDFFAVSTVSGTLEASEEIFIDTELILDNIPTNTYWFDLLLSVDNAFHDTIVIPVTILNNSFPCATLNWQSFCGGNVFMEGSVQNAQSLVWTIDGEYVNEGVSLLAELDSIGTATIGFSACNEFGCQFETAYVNFISDEFLLEPSCQPEPTIPCCTHTMAGLQSQSGELVTRVGEPTNEFYGNRICAGTLLWYLDSLVTLQATYALNSHCFAYLDGNNDGVFQSDEFLFENQQENLFASFALNQTTVVNTPIRLRLFIGDYSADFDPCTGTPGGIVRDYAVVVVHSNIAPIPLFSAETDPCLPQASLYNASLFADSYSWDFGDGQFSNEVSPTHEFDAYGAYSIGLTANRNNVSASSDESVYFFSPNDQISYGPVAISDHVIQFNLGGTYDDYFWHFGDGSGSFEISPTHIYDSPGSYLVSVDVTIGNCEYTLSDLVIIGLVNIEENDDDIGPVVFPSPTHNTATLSISNTGGCMPIVHLYDATGRLVQSIHDPIRAELRLLYEINPQGSGVYYLKWICDGELNVLPMIKLE